MSRFYLNTRFYSLTLYSIFISFVLCSAAFAAIPSEVKDKLDRMLGEMRVEGSIVQEKDQSDAVKASARYISNKLNILGLNQQDIRIWFFALKNISEGTSPPEVVRWEAEPDLKIVEEPIKDFKVRQAALSIQVALIAGLTHYLKGKFPIVPEGGGSCPMEVDGVSPTGAFKGLIPLVAAVTEKMDVEKEEHSGKAPHFTAKQLFTNISIMDHYDGLDVHMEGVKVLRGNFDELYRSGPGGALMAAVQSPVLGLTPMSPVNAEPVRLTSSKASQAFFKGLPSEMMDTNGVWEGYRVDLDRSAFMYTGIYKDPESRAVVPFFFMKRVKAGEHANALNADLESGKLEKAAREKSIQHDMMQAALKLGQGTEWDFPITEAVHNYLVLYPDFEKAEGDAESRTKNERIDLEISRFARDHAKKVEEYATQKKAKNAELRGVLFPSGWRERATRGAVRLREQQLNQEVRNFMDPLGRDLDSLERTLTDLRTEQIKQRLPSETMASQARLARFLLTDLADRGVPLAQYNLAEMWKNGVGGPKDDAKGKHYAQLAVKQGLPEAAAIPNRMNPPLGGGPAVPAATGPWQVTPDGTLRGGQYLMTGNPPVAGGAGLSSRVVQVVPPTPPRPILEGSEDFTRVPAAFAAIGPMHRIGNYILSANGPEFESEGQADGYCRQNGGTLPDRSDWSVIENSWRGDPPQPFNPDLVPGFRNNNFWSETPEGNSGLRFNGTTGSLNFGPFIPGFATPTMVRCIIIARLAQVPPVSGSATSHAATFEEISRMMAAGRYPVAMPDGTLVGARVALAGSPTLVTVGSEDYNRVPAAFAAMGPMHKIGDYILSANGPEFESEGQADGYCRSKGGILPGREWDVIEALWQGDPPQRFNPDLVPDFRGKTFWRKSGESNVRFDGTTGHQFPTLTRDEAVRATVRCLIKPVGITSVRGPDGTFVNDITFMSAVAPALVAVGSVDYGRVSAQFAALGPMHRIGNYILSADGPVFPNVFEASGYCRSIRGELPRWNLWDVMRNEIEKYSPQGIYNPDLVTGLRGKTLWTKKNKVSGTTGLRINEGDAGYSEPTVARCVVSYSMPSTIHPQADVGPAPRPVLSPRPPEFPFFPVPPPGMSPPHAGPLSPILEGSPDFNKVSREFSNLGPMHRLGNYILSAFVPIPTVPNAGSDAILSRAIQFCRNRRAEVPSQYEWRAIKEAMSRGGSYNPDLVPGFRDKVFSMGHELEDGSFRGGQVNGTTGHLVNSIDSQTYILCVKRVQFGGFQSL